MENIKALIQKYIQVILGKTKEVREGGNAFIFLVFLFLSGCFWVLNALQKDNYTTEVSFPIKFSNVDANEIVNGSLKRDLILKIKGGGFKILPYHLKQQFAAKSIDISNLNRVTINGVEGAYLNSKDYYQLIEGKLAVGVELVSITPDTLFIPLTERVTKSLPVKVNASISFEQQCQLSGAISVVPDSIMVAGAQDVLDTMSFVSTRSITFENLSDTIVRNVLLEKPDDVELTTKRVVVTLPVEPFTEASINVPIVANNLPDSLILKAFPAEVSISYHLGLSRPLYENDDFNAVVDFNNIDLNSLPRRLKVKINDHPGQIHNMIYQPLFVEYLLERKESE